MILTVSTVKDTVANLELFCRRNLDAGADHLLVFLDAPDPAVEGFLGAHPQVTHVVTDSSYWTPKRPPSLNTRQLVNANLANALLAGFGWAQWLFHIDADESLQIDRARLLAEISDPLVRINPLEAVSQLSWPGEVTDFKPLLERRQIERLVQRGLIPAPEDDEALNATWFSGHVKGKLGARPDLGVRLELHHGFAYGESEELPAASRPWLEHRHYESHSGEEFVRKWMAHLDAGPIRLRPRRRRLMERIAAIVEDRSLDDAGRRDAFTALYRAEVEDDLPALRQLGVLVRPVNGEHLPEQIPDEDRSTFATLLALLAEADKRAFNPKAEAQPIGLVRALRSGLSDGDPVAVVLDRALSRAAESAAARATPPRRGFLRRR